MKVGIFKNSDGSLQTTYEAAEPNQAGYGGPWGSPDETTHMEIPSGMHPRAVSLGMSQEKWTKEGEDDVTVDPEDESWTHVPSVPAVVEDSTLRTAALAADAQNAVRTAVAAAKAFGDTILIDFATENVILGITADNMTGTVLTKMGAVMAAIQSGSLYEAITRAKAIPSGDYDAKYITEARLITFINKIETYLGVTPLTTDIS